MERNMTKSVGRPIVLVLMIAWTGSSTPLLAAAADAIIADHTCCNLKAVPANWIQQAKAQLRLAYGHTSHGSQIINGMDVFKNPPGSLYWWDRTGTQGGLSIWDGTPTGDLGNPDRTSWAQRTRDLLLGSGKDRNCIVWSWCGQVSNATPADIDTYTGLMMALRTDFPDVKFVYMTGHLDGTGTTGNLHLRNEQIRAHVRATGGILFDFADIESFDPSGNAFLHLRADDGCNYWLGGQQRNWADEWCAVHPGDCSSCSCAHSKSLNCDQKARAFWWLLARIAGWAGPSPKGDLNCDGSVNFADINPFVLAIGDPDEYRRQYPDCDLLNGDCNGDGLVDFGDINPFVDLLS
jgi:hypothetical protein